MGREPDAWRALDAELAPAGETSGEPLRGSTRRPAIRLAPAAAVAVAAVLASAAFLIAASGPTGEVDVSGAGPGEPSEPGIVGDIRASDGAPAAVLVVDVQGAVAHPGVVRVVAGSRVGDAIAAAGGYGPRVAADRIGQILNLAALLRDGDQVVVPSRDDAPATAGGGGLAGAGAGAGSRAGTPAGGGGLVDLNRATAAELDALPGVGPVTAAKIVAARADQPFASVDDLRSRKLVGAATFEKIRALVTVG